jgi:hypothetical protein
MAPCSIAFQGSGNRRHTCRQRSLLVTITLIREESLRAMEAKSAMASGLARQNRSFRTINALSGLRFPLSISNPDALRHISHQLFHQIVTQLGCIVPAMG